MKKNLKHCVAAVTGAGSGIGRAIALNLAQHGCNIAVSDISLNDAGKTAESVRTLGVRVHAYRVDVSDRKQVFEHADQVAEDFEQVNLIVNNAGVGLGARILDMDLDDFSWLMGINFWGVVYGTKAFLPHLIKSGDGHVVNIASMCSFIAVPTQAAYNSAKFAVRGFTETLRQELELFNMPVSATCVMPGVVKTNIAKSARMGNLGTDIDRATIADRFESQPGVTPEKAARIIVRAVERNLPRVLVGPDAKIADLVQRMAPNGYRLITKIFARRWLS